MATVATRITETISAAPLPELIEQLGMAIANAQAALDQNSIATAQAMAQNTIQLTDGESYSLIALGFVPTFYAFTEATIEAKMEFSLAETESFSIEAGISGEKKKEKQIIAASISVAYARKFEQSAEGSSSIAARLVSLPPPDRFQEILRTIAAAAAAEE